MTSTYAYPARWRNYSDMIRIAFKAEIHVIFAAARERENLARRDVSDKDPGAPGLRGHAMAAFDYSCLRSLRIVIVEDQAMLCLFIEGVLVGAGATIVGVAHNVTEATHTAQRCYAQCRSWRDAFRPNRRTFRRNGHSLLGG